MTDHCTCGSPLSADDEACPHCGKPLGPEQSVPEKKEEPEERLEPSGLRAEKAISDVYVGSVLYSTLIPASSAVMLQDFIGSATLPAALVSLAVSLLAGFWSVTLVRWAFRTARYARFPFDMGKLTGLMVAVIALGLSIFGELTEAPKEYAAVAGTYLKSLPIAVRLSSQMTPELFSGVANHIAYLSFLLFHVAAAMLGSIINDAFQQAAAKD